MESCGDLRHFFTRTFITSSDVTENIFFSDFYFFACWMLLNWVWVKWVQIIFRIFSYENKRHSLPSSVVWALRPVFWFCFCLFRLGGIEPPTDRIEFRTRSQSINHWARETGPIWKVFFNLSVFNVFKQTKDIVKFLLLSIFHIYLRKSSFFLFQTFIFKVIIKFGGKKQTNKKDFSEGRERRNFQISRIS